MFIMISLSSICSVSMDCRARVDIIYVLDNGVSRAPDGVRFMAIKGKCSKLLRIQRRCAQYTEDAHVLKQRSAGIAL